MTDGPPMWDEPLVEHYRQRYAPMVRLAYLPITAVWPPERARRPSDVTIGRSSDAQ